MVLENIFNPPQAERHPLAVFGLGFVYGTIALFLSLWIFEEQTSMVMVFLATMAIVPLMWRTLRFEEKKDMIIEGEKTLLKEHAKAMKLYLMLFLGVSLAFTVWYVALPKETTTMTFQVQQQTITNLNQHVTGNITYTSLLSKIFLNNVKVLIFCMLFSLIYGSGAIFILTWNASVIGAAAGNFIVTNIAPHADKAGAAIVGSYFYASGMSLVRYAVHGIPEIFAYIVAGIAGGILSMAVVQHDFASKKFERVLLDVSDLVLLAVFILFVAAIMEVFVTPALL
ncbi:stage II sporulation protein M [Candidatus Woesearchaeota archaeon]|nr:stage II sporulation protein M [Candidatus Woesearchaeota archaeon]